VIAAGVIAVVLYQALHDLTEALRMTRRQWRALAMGATVVVIAAIVLAHPVRRWHSFTQPPPTFTSVGYTQTHFLSGNGNWRYQFWSQAVDELETRPLLGRGAGSFSAWWEQHGPGFVANPHSLYFQTLGDLGLVGFALLAGAFGIGAVAAFRRLRRLTNPLADSVAAALAAFVAYAIAAGVDWLWELPAITAPAVALLALSLAPSEPQLDVVRTRTLWPAVGALAAAAVVLFAADLKLGDWFLTASRSAASRGDLPRALDDARTAHRLQPWSASAQLQVALVQEAQGQLSDAESSVEKAIRLDSSDWRTFYIAARIQKARGAADRAEASLAAVRRLNPHAPVPQGG
jgi:O-antigen ligase